MKKISKILIVGLAMLMAFVGFASAAILPNATPETQGISTDTVIMCDGIVLSTEQYSSELSNQALNGAPLAKGEVYGASTYNGRVMAVNGLTTYVKTVDLNNQNQPITGSNVLVEQQVDFQTDGNGRITGDESAAIFNAGQATSGTEQFMCPFTSAINSKVPPFNEMVLTNGKFDATGISLASQTAITGVAKTGDVPSQIGYSINAQGAGSISAGIALLAQDARGDGTTLVTPAKTVVTPAVKDKCGKVITPEKTTKYPAVYSAVTPSSEMHYSEQSTAMGTFSFAKTVKYTSQVTA